MPVGNGTIAITINWLVFISNSYLTIPKTKFIFTALFIIKAKLSILRPYISFKEKESGQIYCPIFLFRNTL